MTVAISSDTPTVIRYTTLMDATGDLFIAVRESGAEKLVVVVNITGESSRAVPPEYGDEGWVVLGSSGYASGQLQPDGYLVAVRAA